MTRFEIRVLTMPDNISLVTTEDNAIVSKLKDYKMFLFKKEFVVLFTQQEKSVVVRGLPFCAGRACTLLLGRR